MKTEKTRKITEKQLANLHPFQPGKTGNPNGRPPLPTDVKEQRRLMRQGLNEATPAAIALLQSTLDSINERNAIRAAEIILSHTVPKLTEEINQQDDDRPLKHVPDDQLEALLAKIRAKDTIGKDENGD